MSLFFYAQEKGKHTSKAITRAREREREREREKRAFIGLTKLHPLYKVYMKRTLYCFWRLLINIVIKMHPIILLLEVAHKQRHQNVRGACQMMSVLMENGKR